MARPIYTRRGDSGETSLVGGARTPKNSPRVEAYGALDEANSAIGLARAAIAPGGDVDLVGALDFVQHRLFNCASRLATPPGAETDTTPGVNDADVLFLESAIDALTAATSDLNDFVLPAGCESAARLHVARTTVRRAERRILDLAEIEPVDAHVLAFVNRLSDLLFVAARYENRDCGDANWDPSL